MKIASKSIALIAPLLLATSLFAAEDDAKAPGQFQKVLEGINQHSFPMIQEALSQADLTNRILSYHALDAEVESTFKASFWQIIEEEVMSGLPPANSKIKGELIHFTFDEGQGFAAVRFAMPGYRYSFHVFELRHDRRGRLQLVDWFESSKGQKFTAYAGDQLLGIKPTKVTSRKMLTVNSPTDTELFQVTELRKAIRDEQAPRFFEIYDQFDERIKREPFIAKKAAMLAYAMRNNERFLSALEIFAEAHAEDADLALLRSDFFLVAEDVEKSHAELKRFQQHFSVKEGALPAKISAMALALGNAEEAEKYAVQATANEPTLELGYWSLLRALTAAENYAGAVEVLTKLEDSFGQHLDEAKLRRDKYRAFVALAESQAFKDWRAGRK